MNWCRQLYAPVLLSFGLGCGGESQADSGSGGSGGAAGFAGSGGMGSAAGAGGAGGQVCKLDPWDLTERQIVLSMIQASISDADWIAKHTSGVGAGSPRAYGAAVPATTVYANYDALQPEACVGPKTFPPGCKGAFDKACVQFSCESAGVFVAKVWLEPLPAQVPAWFGGPGEPVGVATVQAFEHTTRFVEKGTDRVEISWSGVVELAILSATVRRESSGTSVVQGTEVVSAGFHDKITLVAPEPIEVQVALVPDGGKGTIESAGLQLGVIEQKTIELFDLCGG